MRDKILVFGGTTEGRLFANRLKELGIPHVVSVATEYGKTVEEESGEDALLVGRLDREGIASLLRSGEFAAVVDATHPYATKASEEIKSACDKESFTCLRIVRKDGGCGPYHEKVTYVNDVAEAADALEKHSGNILLLTGSRDLKEITDRITDKTRLYVRIIPDVTSIEKCHEAGITGRQIIAMQGPFSVAMNEALIKELKAGVILTKDSGANGGFEKKILAAENLGADVIVIKNPERRNDELQGLSFEDAVSETLKILGMDVPDENGCEDKERKRKITLAGIGPGDERYHTAELEQALNNADVVFGAKPILDRIGETKASKFEWYDGEKIFEFLGQHPEYTEPVVIFSGDISLCSGAKKAGAFFEEKGWQVRKISGISSVALFAGRIGAALEDTTVISAHGRECDVNGYVRRNEKVIVLTKGPEQATLIAGNLPEGCRAIFGCELGSSQEIIAIFEAGDFDENDIKGKVLLYIENPAAAGEKLIPALRDDEIIRGNVPMTKEEVRAISLRKLGLQRNSVLWDVGAGTGSVSLEAAMTDPTVKVFSVEKNPEAVSLLKTNREKFGLGNMEVVEGTAPGVLTGLPEPSHVFVGGSSGNLKEIIKSCLGSDSVRFVVNCVTLETLGKTMEVIRDLGGTDTEVVQISAARFKEVGSYHMADGMNPVFVIAFEIKVGGNG